jgi:hypothetical protein
LVHHSDHAVCENRLSIYQKHIIEGWLDLMYGGGLRTRLAEEDVLSEASEWELRERREREEGRRVEAELGAGRRG